MNATHKAIIESVVLITGNPGKWEEFKSLIGMEEIHFGYLSLDLPEIQSLDIRQIGAFKTKAAMNELGKDCAYDAVLTDDTALYFNALNGLPGPLIKWFLKALKKEGLVSLIKDQDPHGSVTCLLSLGILKTGGIMQFEGTVNGQFVTPRGEYGFGWDPIFLPDNSAHTYGEMEVAEKNKISHRAEAVNRFKRWLLD